MKLFEIDENFQIQPNKVWIAMIPELANLLKRDKGSKGDVEGRKKLRARKEFIYIYMVCDFGSPLREYDPIEKVTEALKYAELTLQDIDADIKVAVDKYLSMQLKASRSLRTYNSMLKGLDALDKHFEDVDFTRTDDDGRLLYSPDKYAASITRMNKVYDELDKFKKRVDKDLENDETGIRGQATLGDNEAKRTNANTTWSESDIRMQSAETAGETKDKNSTKATIPMFSSISSILKEASEKPQLTDDQIANMKVLGEEDKQQDGKQRFIEL